MPTSSRTWPGDHDLPFALFAESALGAGRVTTDLGDLRFITLRGDEAARGADYGRRMGDAIRRGPASRWANTLRELLKHSTYSGLTATTLSATRRLARRRLARCIPPRTRAMLGALAASSALPLEALLDAHLMPELALWLVTRAHKIRGVPFAPTLSATPSFGCTSVIARTDAHGILHGRNLDAPGRGAFDRFATVTFHFPDDGLAHAAVSSAGLLGAGHTAMNSAGLTLAAHHHTHPDVDLDATPLGHAGHTIMRTARSIEDAVAVLRQFPPVTAWTYVLTEGDTGRAAVIEVAPGLECVTVMPQHARATGVTNAFVHPALAGTQLDVYPPYRRAYLARAKRITECVDRDPPGSPRDVARVLADTIDPDTGAYRLLGPTTAALDTVASVVFEPRARRLWVAVGPAPTSLGWFIPMTLDAGKAGPDLTRRPFLADPSWGESPRGQALQLVAQTSSRAARREGPDRVMVDLEHALAHVHDEPNLHVLAGLTAIKRLSGRRAEGALERALGLEHDPERRAEIRLYTAWALDLQGKHSAARALYTAIAGDRSASARTLQQARRRLWPRGRMTPERAGALHVDFTFAAAL